MKRPLSVEVQKFTSDASLCLAFGRPVVEAESLEPRPVLESTRTPRFSSARQGPKDRHHGGKNARFWSYSDYRNVVSPQLLLS